MEKQRRGNTVKKRATWHIPAIVFLVSFAILGGLFAVLFHFYNDLRHQKLQHLTTTMANKVTKVFTERLRKTEILAALIIQGHGNVPEFETIAAVFVNDPVIRDISLAPNGVVNRIYPTQGNDSVIGLDYLASGGGNEALSAIEAEQLTLAGPLELIQGGQALTGRLPVFLPRPDGGGKMFWGFVGIALNYPAILDLADLDELFQPNVVGEIWRINPEDGEKQIIWRSDAFQLNKAKTSEIRLFNVAWHISVGHRSNLLSTIAPIGCTLAIVLFCLFLSVLVFHYLELRDVKTSLDHMSVTDTLTGLPNRRAIIQKLSGAIAIANATNGSFALVYIDLTGLRQVNETLGHGIGDNVLVETAGTLSECIGARGVVGRTEADKFLVIMPDFRMDGVLSNLLDHIRAQIEKTIGTEADGWKREVNISARIGLAFFPGDGTDIDTLLHCADIKMHEAGKKAEGKSTRSFIPSFRKREA